MTPPSAASPGAADPDVAGVAGVAGVAAVIVLAAGGGTRMKSSRSKLLHELAGRSMLNYAVDAAAEALPEQVVVVVGHQREQVEEHLAEIAPHVTIAVQEEQRGTGHAVQCALAAVEDLDGDVLVTMADVPLLTGQTLSELVATHRQAEAAATVLTAQVADPTGYGRVIRDSDGEQVSQIIEHKDATAEQRGVDEINAGIYVFDAALLRAGLAQITADNAQQEFYLTDVVSIARRQGLVVRAHRIDDPWQTEGVNDRVQLARMGAELNRRIVHGWMRAGVTVIDPATTWVHASVDLAPDVTLMPGTFLEGATSVGAGATLGPDVTLTDVEVGERATVTRTQASLSVIGADATVGPYAYLRPGTTLGAGAKIGTFVEAKNAKVGEGAKVPHLTYVGDAEIGDGANIGAGVIFANYDGVTKAASTVGRGSFVGSGSIVAAPVHIADGAYVAGGSVITNNVAPGELAVARGRQRNIAGWVLRKRAGTKLARAAEAAMERADNEDGHE